jgi:ubiquitin C-terminal hydrolase
MNIGNTCYMYFKFIKFRNSALQCLFNLPNFNNYFLNGKYLQDLRSNSRVADAYAKLVNLVKNTITSS